MVQKAGQFFRDFTCSIASGYAASASGIWFIEYVVRRSVVNLLIGTFPVETARVVGNYLPDLAYRLTGAPVDFLPL